MSEKTAIEIMAETLATMTTRAHEAERERDEARQSSDRWYQHYQRKNAQCQELEDKLTAEVKDHQDTRQRLREIIEKYKKEAGGAHA